MRLLDCLSCPFREYVSQGTGELECPECGETDPYSG